MKISFLGAGAIGSMFGGLLKHHAPKLDVLLLVRGEHGEAIAREGTVKLLGPWGTLQVPIDWSFEPADIAGSDYVFITVKSQAAGEALRQAADHLGDASVISIQNGINDEVFAKYVPLERLVMGMTSTNMVIDEPGRVSMQLDGHTIFGPPAGVSLNGESMNEQTDDVVSLLRRIDCPGLQFSASDQLLGVRYNKLIINALGYASCLSASNFITEALAYRPWRVGVGMPIVAESKRIIAASGVDLQPIPGRSDLSRIESLMQALSLPIIGRIVRLAIQGKFNRKPIVFSLYQDLKRGKLTEVDHINGQLVRLAKSVGVESPVNAKIVALTHELESRPAGSFYDRQEVIDSIAKLTTP
ncbi:MAG: ketopantoate reductase family protein [Aeoliella sp.]